MSSAEDKGPILRRLASSRRNSDRFYSRNEDNKSLNDNQPWIDNSFMSKKNTPNDAKSSMKTPAKLKSGVSENNGEEQLIPPGTPDLFGDDSFNETDPFLANLDIEAIEQGASQNSNNNYCSEESTNIKCSQSQNIVCIQGSHKPNVKLKSTDLLDGLEDEMQSKNSDKSLKVSTNKSKSEFLHDSNVIDNSNRNSKKDSLDSMFNSKKTVSTPVTSNLSCLNRLKRTLQKNATTPQNTSRQQLKAREESLQIPAIGGSDVMGSEFGIGPFYGLPARVRRLFEELRGITKLYDWQHECLSLEAVTQGKNLIYSLPTSGGKTLVAEILILRELLCKKKDALLVLPFVSIVQEKVRGLSKFAVELDFHVEEYAASKGAFPPRKRRKRRSVYIATIEKANSLVNSLIEENRLQELGLVVVDELHMLGEGGSRGAVLEMCLTKLLHAPVSPQIIAMSATLNNIHHLQDFLKAHVYSNDFRPVELREYVKVNDTIYEINSSALCPDDRLKHDRVVTFKYDKELSKHDPDHIAGLVMEVAPQHSCLIFCPTKKNCENVANLICKLMGKDLRNHKHKERHSLLRQLGEEGNGEICPVLRNTVPYGVAYHHSGLTMDERKTIEDAYRDGVLCVLCATSTLAAGVNLPAKRVILRSPYIGASFLSRSQYKQMVGRAGRAGMDSSGESIIIMQTQDRNKLLDLVGGPYDSCSSSLLYDGGKGMRHLMLTTVGLKLTPSPSSVTDFLQSTLCHVQNKDSTSLDLAQIATTALQNLSDQGLIIQKRTKLEDGTESSDLKLEVTELGKAVFKGSVDIDRGPDLYKDLCSGQQALCVVNYLHLLFLVTPYDMVDQVKPNWMTYLDEISRLNPSEQELIKSIGISEVYVAKKASGQRVKKGVNEFIYCRFYLTLMLYRLWKQQTIWHVARTYQLSRGFVQQLLSGAAAFASCVAHFCKELENFWAYQDLLSSFVRRLTYCVTMELIELVEIPGVKIGRAKQLYNAGYRSLQMVAHAHPETIVKAIEYMPRKTANQIITSAKMVINERAEALREEAEDMISVPSLQEDNLDQGIDSSQVSTLMDSESQFDDSMETETIQSSGASLIIQ